MNKLLTISIFLGSCYILLWLWVPWPEIMFHEIANCPAFMFLPWVSALTFLNGGLRPGSTRWNKFFPTHTAFDQSVLSKPPRKETLIVTLMPSMWHQLCMSWLTCYDTHIPPRTHIMFYSYRLTQLILKSTWGNRYCYQPHFTDERICQLTWLGSFEHNTFDASFHFYHLFCFVVETNW